MHLRFPQESAEVLNLPLMKLVQKIREVTGRILSGKYGEPARFRRGYALNNAEKVLVVFCDEDEDRFRRMKKLFKELKDDHSLKLVKGLAYIEGSEKDVSIYHAHKLEMDYLTSNELSWNAKASAHLRNLEREEFHILIDIADCKHPVLDHFIAHSQSAMKVGRQGSGREASYDLMVEAPESFRPPAFFTQVTEILSKLKIE